MLNAPPKHLQIKLLSAWMKQSLNPIAIWRQHRDARRHAHNAAVESRFAEPSAAQYNARKAPVASELNQEQQIAADERLARALMVEEEEQIAAEAEAARERQHEMNEKDNGWKSNISYSYSYNNINSSLHRIQLMMSGLHSNTTHH